MTERADGRIHVLLADASEFTLLGLRQVLEREQDIAVIDAVTDGESLVARAVEREPDVVVTDLSLPVLSGDGATQRLRRELPRVGIVILTARDEEQSLFDSIRAGANAYLPKDCPPNVLVSTIRQVREGKFLINDTVFSRPAVASRVLTEFRDLSVYGGPPAHDVFARLTPREVQILDSIAQGRTNKEVGVALQISEQTVKNHMSSILRKLSVNDRTQAVVYALRQGWIVGAPRVDGAERRTGADRRQTAR